MQVNMKLPNQFWKWALTKFGDINVSFELPRVRAKHCRDAMAYAAPGDVILRKYNRFLDGMFIPGRYSHSGIIKDKNTVIHAVAEGVQEIDILDFIKDTDGFAILSPNKNPNMVVDYAVVSINSPYDFSFEVEAGTHDDYFCHELTAQSLCYAGILIIPELRSIGPVTHEVYTADQFLNDKRLKIVYEALPNE